MRRRSQKLKKRLSQSDTAEAVDFEITLAALLATASLAYPHPAHPLASYVAGFAVLIVTLGRRMIIQSAFAGTDDDDRKDWLLRVSVPLLEVSTVSAILLLLLVFQSMLPPFWLDGVLFWIGAGVAMIGLAAIQELIYRDELIWWYQKFKARAEENPDSAFWPYLAMRAWKLSRAPIADNASGRFSYGPSETDDSIENPSLRTAMKYLVKGAWLYLVIHGIIVYFGYSVVGVAGVFAVLVLSLIRDQIRFWYAQYGSSSFDQLSGPWYRSYLMLLIYLVEVRILL